ncbi:hypothetical protein Syun_021802 [Stephania yunnanensis]|uniref:Uncharacterized protein n=1 Tax=Stephania yunnanensis TaxID=152371 RepID=A0AAP0IH24_9MAGN
MAVDMSPRISFSHDLCQSDVVRIEHLDQTISPDFDFCVFEIESSTADELFSDGKLLPLEIKKQQPIISSQKPPIAPPSRQIDSKKESLKEMIEKSSKTEEKIGKSFWRFTRSSSCGNGYKKSLICSLPLLSRSNSTGSAPNPKRTTSATAPLLSQRSSNKASTIIKSSSSSSSTSSCTSNSSSSSSSYSSYLQKPPLKKNQHHHHHHHHNNGIRISPVLNVPPPYISKGTVNLFGLGSLFCNGKDKAKKKC